MARIMLNGPAKARYDAIGTEICDQPGKDHLAEETLAPGETDETFKEVSRAFAQSHLKSVADSLLTQREYLQHGT